MKTLKYLCYYLLFIFTAQLYPQNYFPLEVGNRWDYFVDVEYPGGYYLDTFSIEIIDQKILTNGIEYYEFSKPYPFWYKFVQSYFVREESSFIYFFDEEDSIDCFAFRFDLPQDTFYLNCKNDETQVWFVSDSFSWWGVNTDYQTQSFGVGYSHRFFNNFGVFEYDDYLWLQRYYYDLSGCIVSGITYGELLVSVENDEDIPKTISLSQNYPNPFNPGKSIQYALSSRQFVKLKVYDVLGNEIATLINEGKSAGSYEIEFPAKDRSASGGDAYSLPSGIYLYRLQVGNYVETKKMILLK